MMKKMMFVFSLVFIVQCLFAQNLLNQPESVAWDHIHQQWLVSNHASGQIVAIDTSGTQTYFNTDLSSTRGLKVREDTLYAASNDGLACISLMTGELLRLIPITTALLLNDLDFDGDGNLFVSDYWGKKIFKIATGADTASLFIDYGEIAPNGLIFDAENNRMLVCAHNAQNATLIHSFDVTTAETQAVLYPYFYSLDGFARDIEGNICVSAWHTDAVYRFDGNNITNNVEMIASGLVDPADIFIHPETNVLAVPNFSADSVSFIELPLVNATETITSPCSRVLCSLRNYPNPFNPETTIHYSMPDTVKNPLIKIYNSKGQCIQILACKDYQGSVQWDGCNQNGEAVASGIYLYCICGRGFRSQMRKMALLK